MPGAKFDCAWSPCSSETSEAALQFGVDGMGAKSFFSSCVGVDSVSDLMLSPEAASEGCAFDSFGIWGSSSLSVTLDRSAIAGSNTSLPGYRPAAGQGQQSQHDTPALLAAIVDGALQAAAAPGMLSVSAAGPQQLAARPTRSSPTTRTAANSMFDGPSQLYLQQFCARQGGSQQRVDFGWPASS